jgi:hypothetical protein
MLAWLRVAVSKAVMQASARGNPLARKLNAKATQDFIASLPQHSSIVPGPFEIPDPDRPIPQESRTRWSGEFELKPLKPVPVAEADLIGRTVTALRPQLGGYGMGEFGFFGLRLDDDWLIVPLYAAAEWIALDGRLLADPRHETDGRPAPWLSGDLEEPALTDRLVGQKINAASLGRDQMTIGFANGAQLAIDPDPAKRPRMEHGGHARAFLPDDDLAAALFFSPSPEFYG